MGTTQYVFNTVDNSADLDLLVGGNLETTYYYQNNNVTLSERPNDVTIDFAMLKNNINEIFIWISLIDTHLQTNGALTDFSLEVQKTATVITYKLELAGEEVIDATYTIATGNTLFLARPEVILSWQDFKRFADTLLQLIREIEKL